MDTTRITKKITAIILSALIIGLLLLGVGLTLGYWDRSLLPYRKGIIALSFIPLAIAMAAYVKLSIIQRHPEKMKNIIAAENDERLRSLKNEADAKAFRITQSAIFLSYFGYTLLFPDDIFETAGWWILLALLLVSFISQGIMSYRVNKSNRAKGGQ